MSTRVIWFGAVLLILAVIVVPRLAKPSRDVTAPEPAITAHESSSSPSAPVLASVEAPGLPGLRVDVTEARRPSRDTVEIRMVLVNTSLSASVSIADHLAERPEEAGTLSAAFLTNDTNTTRHYVLRDDEGRPSCTTGLTVLAPGERRRVWVRFASPGGSARPVTLQLKGLPPLTRIALPPAPS